MRHRKLQSSARLRNEFDLEPMFLFFLFSLPPFVFLYVCSAGFWVLISGEVIVAGGRGRRAGAVNALQTGRRRATKKATAYSKATVQLLSHAKHSNVLCKG